MRIVVTDYIEPDLDWEEKQVAALGGTLESYQMKSASSAKLAGTLSGADIAIVNMAKIDSTVLDGMKKCKLIIRHGVGYDNIDIPAATERGIQVCYVPDYCADEVAEQAIMLLLATYRKFGKQIESMSSSIRKGEWDFSEMGGVKRVRGKRGGLIGCGRIGSRVLTIMRSLGLEVMVSDPYLTKHQQEELGVKTVSLEQVLSEADLISIHCSLDDSTRHLIGERELSLMKKDAVLVNTARGPLVDANALAKVCREGRLAGAGIDVFESEPPKENFELIGLENVILTPHLSWFSEDAAWEIRKKIIEDVERHVKGEPPRFPLNRVNANG